MNISPNLSDDAALQAIGERLAQYRLNRNLTQASLAREAGVSLSTLNRIESGQSSQATNLIRIIRALGLLENLESFIPTPAASPVQQLKLQGKQRKRASSLTRKESKPNTPWAWDIPNS